MDQFRNFKRFIDKVDKYGMKSGIVKVIPPADWYISTGLNYACGPANLDAGASLYPTFMNRSNQSESRTLSRKSLLASTACTQERTLRSSDHTTCRNGGQ